MNADYDLIGKHIAQHRHQAGLTQEQLAEICHISVTHINRIENGRRKASLDLLISIADTLGTTVNVLLAGNQQNDYREGIDDISELLMDCTSAERQSIVQIISAIKPILKNQA